MNSASKQTFLFLTLCGTLLLPLSSHAGIKCWTNKEGIRECGNMVPPEYAQQESRTINERGITTGVTDRAKTSEELKKERERLAEEERQKAEEAQRQAEEEQRRKEQAAYDRVLLATFLTEDDIIRSRDRKLSVIDATIELTRTTRDKLQEKLEKEEAHAARYKNANKPVPENIQKELISLNKQIDDKESYIASKVKERIELTDKYAADLARFQELKAEGRTLR